VGLTDDLQLLKVGVPQVPDSERAGRRSCWVLSGRDWTAQNRKLVVLQRSCLSWELSWLFFGRYRPSRWVWTWARTGFCWRPGRACTTWTSTWPSHSTNKSAALSLISGRSLFLPLRSDPADSALFVLSSVFSWKINNYNSNIAFNLVVVLVLILIWSPIYLLDDAKRLAHFN